MKLFLREPLGPKSEIEWPDFYSEAISLKGKPVSEIVIEGRKDRFLTLDERQSILASLAGIKIECGVPKGYSSGVVDK